MKSTSRILILKNDEEEQEAYALDARTKDVMAETSGEYAEQDLITLLIENGYIERAEEIFVKEKHLPQEARVATQMRKTLQSEQLSTGEKVTIGLNYRDLFCFHLPSLPKTPIKIRAVGEYSRVEDALEAAEAISQTTKN